MTEPEGFRPSRVKRALADAAWMFACVGAGWVATQAVNNCFPGMSGRRSGLNIDQRRDLLLFTFTPWKKIGVDDGIALILAEWVFAGIVAVALYLPIRWWRRRTGRMSPSLFGAVRREIRHPQAS